MLTENNITNVLDDRMMEYSAYVLLHRALPDVRDGFKPALRRILYTMKKDNFTKLTKSAKVDGATMAIHPHGSTYPTVVNMVQKDNHINPFIDGKGAFAYHTSRDAQPASMRYSEVKIADYSLDMMKNLNKGVVNMMPTFDAEDVEPEVLPVLHPNILTHAQEGMAVGFACKFPSFNLIEVCDATKDYIKTGNLVVLYPDFATGGYIINDDNVELINKTGRGSVTLKARYEFKEGRNNNYILVKEIPYSTTREQIIEKIIDLVKCGKYKDLTRDIVDIKDTTDINGMEIEITIKKNVNADTLMSKLYKMTSLEDKYSANMTILDDKKPVVVNIKDILDRWITFRRECICNEIEYDINKTEIELMKSNGIALILNDLDKAIAIIRAAKSEEEAINGLIQHFKLSKEQADYVSTIKLINMNKDWLKQKVNRIKELENEIETLKTNKLDVNYVNSVIIEQLEYVKKKYGKSRRTEIVEEVAHHKDVIKEMFVEDYNCQIVVTKEGYIKKTLKYSDTQKLKDGDEVLQQISSNNRHKLLLFTDKANLYYLNVNDIDTILPSNLGQYIPNILGLNDEKIIYAASTGLFNGYMVFAFENGKIAKIDMSAYQTKTNRTKIINAYNTDSKLVSMMYIEKDVDVFCISSINKGLLINTNCINSKSSKVSQGNMILKSKNDSVMASCEVMANSENYEYYRGTSSGIGKYLKKK